MSPAEIGRIVRAARRAQGLRQDQLAGAAGVGVRFLSELERGKTTVRLAKVLAVLDTLGCNVRIEPPLSGAAPSDPVMGRPARKATAPRLDRFSSE